jgi:hypothetical protein
VLGKFLINIIGLITFGEVLMSVESPYPLVEFGYVSTASTTRQKLVEYLPPLDKTGYVWNIEASFSAASVGVARITLIINKEEKITDELIAHQVVRLLFGGALELKGGVSKGIEVYVKSDGVTTIAAHGAITGIEKVK